MITAIIQQKGKPIPEVITQEIGKLAEQHTLLLAEQHKIELDRAIEDTRVRPLKEEGVHLTDQIHVEKLANTTPGYGVGNVETLNKKAPWWCLREDTEVYVKRENKIVPMSLKELYLNKGEIKEILTPYGLRELKNIWVSNTQDKYLLKAANYFDIHTSGEHVFPVKLAKNVIEKKIKNLPEKSISSYGLLYASLNSINNEETVDFIETKYNKLYLDFNYGFVLGFILGDGNITDKRVTIAQKHIETGNLLTEIKTFCKKFNYFPGIYQDNSGFCNMYKIQLMQKDIVASITYFLGGVKTNKKFIDLFLNTPKEFRIGILTGYKFSDGHKETETGDNIRTISPFIKQQLLIIASSLGYDISDLKNQKRIYEHCYSKYPLLTASYRVISRYHHLSDKFNFFNVKKINKDIKKRNKLGQFIFESYIVPQFKSRIKSIKKLEKIIDNDTYYDLCVDGELFLINGGIVSHNCWINYGRAGTGRTVPPSDIGSFTGLAIPTKGAKGGSWQHGKHGLGGNVYKMVPTKPISAHNYIEKALGIMVSKVKGLLK